MRWLPSNWRRSSQNSRDVDLDRELRSHLDAEAEAQREAGLPQAEALDAARRAFGNQTAAKEATREIWSRIWVERLAQDLGYALRTLRKNPGFTAVAVVSLALGIGANTAIFTLLNALVLRELPVHDPSRLVQLEMTYRGGTYNAFSYPSFTFLRNRSQTMASVFAWSIRPMSLGRGSDAERVVGMYASGNYYTGLGVPAVLGRTLLPSDEHRESPAVAVLSHSCWHARFAADPGVLGRAVWVEGVPVTIVGVTAAWFSGTEVGRSPDIVLPVSLRPALSPDRPWLKRVDAQWLSIMARLTPGGSEQNVRAELEVLWPRMVNELDPQRLQGLSNKGVRVIEAGTGLSHLRRQFSKPLLVLMGVVALVLVIACANVANLLVARAAARQREITVRLAIGATRSRLVRQLLTESVLLAFLGSAAGLLFALWCSSALMRMLSSGGRNVVHLNLQPDWRVLTFTSAAAVFTGVLFGLAPALRATRADLNDSLRGSTHQVRQRRRRLDRAITVSQVALCLLLLIGAGLFLQSLQRLLTVDLGFRPEGVIMAQLNPARAGYRDAALADLYARILERVSALPGVQSASLSVYPPITGGGGTFFGADTVSVDGRPILHGTPGHVYLNHIAPRFFETLGTAFVAGRDFGPQDHGRAPRVSIVSEAFARFFFPNGNPVGRQIRIGSSPPTEIVGVVKDAKYETLREEPHRIVYSAYMQDLARAGSVYVDARVLGNTAGLAGAIRQEIRSIAPQVPVETITMRDWVSQFLAQERLLAVLSSGFGFLALVLAGVGLYGVMAYTVTQRTGEIGIRMALGARSGEVLWQVLREALILVLSGIALGIPVALALGRVISSMLYQITPADPTVLLTAVAVILAAGLLAGYLPARRASRVDPMTALRNE